MEIVRRAVIPSAHSVMVDGREHNLGLVKDFRKHPRLDEFLPHDCETSMSWVRLEPEEVLEVHTHPIPSLVLVREGQGRTLGDVEDELEAGDAVLIRTGDHHGFVGRGPSGFWGLSMQFEPRALYEDLSDPWVAFEGLDRTSNSGSLQALLARNEEHRETFSTHRIFSYAQMGRFEPPEARRKLLDGLQVWSEHFQRVVQARAVFAHDERYAALARRHRDEELGHDELLRQRRPDARCIWDPFLEATASWFTWKVLNLSDLERLVLVHLVLEAAGEVFYARMQPLLRSEETDPYLAAHAESDGDHVQMAMEHLERHNGHDWEALAQVLRQGWSMLGAMLGRIADMAVR